GQLDIDGGEGPALLQLAVEVQFHVAGALELFVDHVVHAAPGIDQRGGDDRDAPALLDLPRGAEEPFGPVEGGRIQSSREGSAAGRNHQVVRAGKPGEAVEQDDDVAGPLDEPLRPLEHEIGDLHVLFRRAIEGGGDDL